MNATIFALYLWTTVGVGAGNYQHPVHTREDWRHAGNFASVQKCEAGASHLGLKAGTYRCIDTGMTTK